jgi:hypothetical protein
MCQPFIVTKPDGYRTRRAFHALLLLNRLTKLTAAQPSGTIEAAHARKLCQDNSTAIKEASMQNQGLLLQTRCYKNQDSGIRALCRTPPRLNESGSHLLRHSGSGTAAAMVH